MSGSKWDLPPVPAEQLKFMTEFFQQGKALVGDRFPVISQENVEAWCRALPELSSISQHNVMAALARWSNSGVTNRMVSPKDIRDALKEERKAWENTPQGRAQLRAYRRRMEDLRDRQLKDGTFAQLRGFQPREIEAKPNVEAIADLRKLALEKIQAGREKLNGDR